MGRKIMFSDREREALVDQLEQRNSSEQLWGAGLYVEVENQSNYHATWEASRTRKTIFSEQTVRL